MNQIAYTVWANEADDHKSISGNVFKVFGGIVSYRYGSEVSYICAIFNGSEVFNAVYEVIWLRKLVLELRVGLQ